MTLDRFLRYLQRDLSYLQGIGDALDNSPIKAKIHSMMFTLKKFKESEDLESDEDMDSQKHKPKEGVR